MKTEIKKLDSTKREVAIEVSGDIVKNKFDDVFKKIAQEAKVPGFRAGTAPRDILEKHYSAYAQEQVIKELVPDIYNQAIEKEGLDVVELPNISEVKLCRDSLSFKAEIEVSPEITVKKYKGIKLDYKKISVSPDELKRDLEALKELHKADAIDDRFAKSMGYPDLAELGQAIERHIFIQKENLQHKNLENEVIEALTRDLDFKIPQSLVNRQLQELLRQAKVELALKGFPKEKIEEQEKALSGQLEPQAKKQVKVYLVLAELAKRENIPQDEHMQRRAMEFLLREADWQKINGGG